MCTELQKQRIAVTGSAGFIGSHLIRELYEKEKLNRRQLLAVDFAPETQKNPCCKNFLEWEIPTLEPQEFLKDLEAGRLQLDAIFHMGASSSTEETNWDYLEEVNLNYSKKLWEICTQKGIPLFYASSAATYGDGKQGFEDELATIADLKPLNLYGKSKQLFDLFVLEEAAHKRTPPRWAGFKFFNVYGPGEEHKKNQASVVYHAARQFREQGFVKLFQSHHPDFEDGHQMRDFIYVGDLSKCLFEFSTQNLKSSIYNLGTGKARTFIDLAQAVASALDVECKIEYIPTPEKLREHYQYYTQASMKRLKNSWPEWQATSLEEGCRLSLT